MIKSIEINLVYLNLALDLLVPSSKMIRVEKSFVKIAKNFNGFFQKFFNSLIKSFHMFLNNFKPFI